MPARMVVELDDGHKILFGGKGRSAGISEVSVADDVTKATVTAFKSALGSLAGLIAAIEDRVAAIPKRPEKIEMEFRASLTGECDLWVVSGDAEAEFKVTLTWGKD